MRIAGPIVVSVIWPALCWPPGAVGVGEKAWRAAIGVVAMVGGAVILASGER